jgi:prepilin-type N-terminal cleavage/methylation domain-containing protein
MRSRSHITRFVSALRRRAAAEAGFSMIEMLVAMLVLAVGIVATLNVFSSSKAVSVVAQRYEVGVHQAQRELERLRSLTYAELGLNAQPAVGDRLTNDATRIGYFNGPTFTVKSAASGNPAVTEQLVLPATNPTGTVVPAPTTFRLDLAGADVSGKVYRYVTWRPENCGTDGSGAQLCPGDQDTKRIVVGVTMDQKGGRAAPANPIWVSSVVIDPTSEPYE